METTTQTADTSQQTQQAATTQQTTTAPVDFRTFLDERGTFVNKAWAGEEKGLADKFTSVDGLIKSYRTLEKMNSSGNKVAIPGENATPEEWEAFHGKMRGVAKEDDYAVTVPDELKGVAMDDAAIKQFKGLMFKAGAPAKVVEAAAKFYFETVGKSITAENQRREKSHTDAVDALASEWGGKDSVKYKEQVALAEKGAAASGLTGDVLKATPELSNNPHFIRAMAKVGAMIGEKGAANLRSDGGANNLAANPKAEIDAVMQNPKHPYWNKGDPGHKDAKAKMEALFKQLHGDTPAM